MPTIQEISELIRTQDNRCTDQPMFIVQEKVRDYGYDPEYSDDYVWLDVENNCVEPDGLPDAMSDPPSDWTKAYYRDRWEFVTACFTEQGCKDFIAADGHNHGELRIYADGSYRNAEFRAVREFLLGQGVTDEVSAVRR